MHCICGVVGHKKDTIIIQNYSQGHVLTEPNEPPSPTGIALRLEYLCIVLLSCIGGYHDDEASN